MRAIDIITSQCEKGPFPFLADSGGRLAHGAHWRQQHGFTLIELLVTLAVLVIVSTIAVPAWQGFIASQEENAQQFELRAILAEARSEAIKRGHGVTLCPLDSFADPTSCKDTDTEQWNAGMVLFRNASGSETPSDDNRIRVFEPMRHGWQLSVNQARFTFDALGGISGLGGTLTLCQGEAPQSALVLSGAGRIRVDTEPSEGCT